MTVESASDSPPRGKILRILFSVLFGVALVGYPLIVFVLLRRFSARYAALFLLVLFLPGFLRRGLKYSRGLHAVAIEVAGVVLLLTLAALFDNQIFLLHLPVLIAAFLLFSFAYTLLRPPTMIERYARLGTGELSEAEVRYCTSVTYLWMVFFLFNGLVIEGLILWSSFEAWTLYVGVVGYLLMGLLFGLEMIYRRWRFGRFGLVWLDRLFGGKKDGGGGGG